MKHLLWLNPVLQLFGCKIVRSNLGHWVVVGGRLHRISIPMGYRFARRGQWEGLPENATELDRFVNEARRRGAL